ncbi:hypothetical protein [Sphingomonas sp.]|uniref:hypothetical protein n=1 Tax=Sphingomonas sp. TaxID=28214 RepID=UPI002FDAAA96
MTNSWGAALALLMLPAAQDAPKAPAAVAALGGCWRGEGAVMGKPVTLALTIYPIVEGAMFAIDAESVAKGDPKDRYAAHLLFGDGGEGGAILGYWADSFGAAYASSGKGAATADGFAITYPYPDADFLNQWHRETGMLAWQITARDKAGKETLFARYTLRAAPCGREAR